jgi:periplasmic divalent cation tolerance protein
VNNKITTKSFIFFSNAHKTLMLSTHFQIYMTTTFFVYITTQDQSEAERIGRTLVEERLVACVNILDGMKSMYWWEGELQTSQEAVLIAKTNKERLSAVTERVAELHSYACPCIVALPIEQGYDPFLIWVHNSVR